MVGEKLGSFRIEGTLGVGAMGVVYSAVHEATGRAAAVKVVNKEIAQRGKTYERFTREAEILKQFRHPNIVRFLALGRYQGTSYIAMEFIQGKTLEQVLEDRTALPWQEVVELGIQLCEALHYAHEHGVVHRDLKPSNLMVTDDGVLKLTDFGIAKDLDKTALTATGRTLGTAAYMAPEQIRGTPEVSHKTDLYAFGCVLYQMLVGKAPFEGSGPVVLMHCHMNEPAPRPSGKVAEIPRALDDLVIQLMAKDANDRPWDATAVGESLKKIREKAQRGETVAMVWSTEEGDATGLTRQSPVLKKKKGKSKNSATFGGYLRENQKFVLETLGLVLALAVVVGIGAYIYWPLGAPTLYAKAEKLMQTDNSHHEWDEALREYIEPLERRFPDQYKTAIEDWRGKIALDESERRAKYLESPVAGLNKPQNETERKWVEYFGLVSPALTVGDNRKAIELWQDLASKYDTKDPKERPWQQLAKKRAETLSDEMESRLTTVKKLVIEAVNSRRNGDNAQADEIMKRVQTVYGKHKEVQELLAPPPTIPAPETQPAATDEPAKPPAT